MTKTPVTFSLIVAAALGTALPALADGELNLYSSRHYDTDERLYSDFTAATGITINRIEGKADELIARIVAEGANSPADVLLTVDTSRLERAKDAGALQATESDILEAAVPSNLQDSDNQWFGFSQRARIIFFNKETVKNPPKTYAELADPAYKGLVCIRSSTNTYNQTLLASIIEHNGAEAGEAWAKGVVDNMARAPQGGDTDQLRGVVSGECGIAVANTYYFARGWAKDVKGLSDGQDNIGWVFPDQEGNGAHVNLSGGGVAAHAPNKDNAVKFLEYLVSEQAQSYFANGNNEFPVVASVKGSAAVQKLGEFKADAVDLSAVAKKLPMALETFNKVGWE